MYIHISGISELKNLNRMGWANLIQTTINIYSYGKDYLRRNGGSLIVNKRV